MPKKRPSKPARSPKPKRRSPTGSARSASESSARSASESSARSASESSARSASESSARRAFLPAATKRKSSSLLDTRVIFCGDNLQKLADFPDALTEPPPAGCHGLLAIRAPFRRSGKSIIALTVQKILGEEIAKKLA